MRRLISFGSLSRWQCAALVIGSVLVFGLTPPGAHATASHHALQRQSALAEVQFIDRGLTVQPPKQPPRAGRVQQALYDAYFLQTGKEERASIGFADRTVLHLNQRTDAVLRSAHLTYVQRGEVQEDLAPGTDHRVQTATAIAGAIGTTFDVKIVGSTSIFVVIEGVVIVQNDRGSVVIKSNQQTTVPPGKAPSPPSPANAQAVTSWTQAMPSPDVGENIALDANGGSVVAASSENKVSGARGAARYAVDGRLDTGWETASGMTTNQWVKIRFWGGKTYLITSVILATPEQDSHSAASGVRNFEIRVSTTGTDDASFVTVMKGTCKQRRGLQHFDLSHPVQATYVELYIRDNYGDPTGINVGEFEVVGSSGASPGINTCPLVHPCIDMALGRLNTIRLQNHLAPFAFSDAQSIGTPSCVGSYGHSVAMAQTGTLWHTDTRNPKASYPNDICLSHRTASENVGYYPGGDERAAVGQMIAEWMQDRHDPSACKRIVSHACNILNPSLKVVGMGIYYAKSRTWFTLSFVDSIVPSA